MPFINTRQDLEDLKPALIESIEFVQSINIKNIKNMITIRNILIFIYLNLLFFSVYNNKYILLYHIITSILMITIIKIFHLYSGINSNNNEYKKNKYKKNKSIKLFNHTNMY
jgi:hypothetical protein